MVFKENDFLDEELSQEMIDIGLNEECPYIMIYEAQKWFRERGINIDVRYNYISKYYFATVCDDNDWFETVRNGSHNTMYATYESALTDAIRCAIVHYKEINKLK